MHMVSACTSRTGVQSAVGQRRHAVEDGPLQADASRLRLPGPVLCQHARAGQVFTVQRLSGGAPWRTAFCRRGKLRAVDALGEGEGRRHVPGHAHLPARRGFCKP